MATVSKSAVEEIHVDRKVWKGREYLDVRIHHLYDGVDKPKATPKGLILKPELWAELLPILTAELKSAGLLES